MVPSTNILNIGSQRELFLDYYLIDKIEGARLKLHEPKSGGIAISFDQTWEKPKAFYTTVLKDSDTYRMYYRSGSPGSPICYAESNDGATWVKPNLNLVEINGSHANNAILTGSPRHTFCPFLDTNNDASTDSKFKANFSVREPTNLGLVCLESSDGIHWNHIEDIPLIPPIFINHFDSQNVMFWSETENRYLLFARHMQEGRRATAKSYSYDFINWSHPILMRYSDTDTTLPDSNLYTNQTTPYFRAPHIYIALSARIFFSDTKHVQREDDIENARNKLVPQNIIEHHNNDKELDINGAGDYSDGVVLTSRAGSEYYDFIFKESIIRPGIGLTNWTSRNNYPALGLIPTSGKEMSFYVHRDYSQKSAHLERMTLRLDGIASLNAHYHGGEMITKPFIFNGSTLELNYSTSAAGKILIELQNPTGTPIPNYTLEDCSAIQGDEIQRTVFWPGKNSKVVEGGPNLKILSGLPIRMKFVMKDSDLYSIKFI